MIKVGEKVNVLLDKKIIATSESFAYNTTLSKWLNRDSKSFNLSYNQIINYEKRSFEGLAYLYYRTKTKLFFKFLKNGARLMIEPEHMTELKNDTYKIKGSIE